MMFRNSPLQWGAVTRSFHWVIAILIIGMLCLGLYMTDQKPGPAVFKLFFLHKSTGIVILGLVILRLLWRLTNIKPDDLPNHKPWEKGLAHFIHFFIYVAALGMPLSGWIMSSAKNFTVSVFGLFSLPNLVGPSDRIAHLMITVHEKLAWALIGALCLHAAGALKHHIIDRDPTLRRMLPFAKVTPDEIPTVETTL